MKAPITSLSVLCGILLAAPLAFGAGRASIAANPGSGPILSLLSEPQRASYQMALGAERGRIAELQMQLRAARQELFTAGLGEKFDENAVRAKAMAVAKIDAELTVVRLQAFSKVQPPLTADQIEKIKLGLRGQVRPLGGQPLERAPRREFRTETNLDENGLPPKH